MCGKSWFLKAITICCLVVLGALRPPPNMSIFMQMGDMPKNRAALL
jgi:hypothetical protein